MLVRLRLTRKLPPSRLDSSGEITLKYFPRWYPRRRRGERGRKGRNTHDDDDSNKIYYTRGRIYIRRMTVEDLISFRAQLSLDKSGSVRFPFYFCSKIVERNGGKTGQKTGGCKSFLLLLLLFLLLRFRSNGIAKLTNQFT